MKRYSVYSQSGCKNCDIEEDSEGDLVKYEDVVKLLSRIKPEELAEALLQEVNR